MQLPIIYEDSEIIVISKPHGLHTIQDRQAQQVETVRSLLDSIYGKIYIVHRLDAGTGGVLICAKTSAMHAHLCHQFDERKVQKEYCAIVAGKLAGAVTVMLPISAKIAHGKYKINFKSGKPATTSFIPLKITDNATLVQAIPYTGRSHQIRVHLRALKHPLYYDWVYNTPTIDHNLTLFAKSISITLPNGQFATFSADLSDYMKSVMSKTQLDS